MNECILCGAPGGYPYCNDECRGADSPDDGPAVEFTPTREDGFDGPFYGLLVTEYAEGDQLIAVGPNITPRRALAAFAAYRRHHDPHGIFGDLADLRKGLTTYGHRVIIHPTRFERPAADPPWTAPWWRAIPHPDATPAAWL